MTSFNPITSFPILLIHLHFILFFLINITLCPLSSNACHEEERRDLLNFKLSLDDPSGRLSSWQENRNCCAWHGIQCSHESLHVVSIDLRNTKLEDYINDYNTIDAFDPPSTSLRGKLSPSLLNITSLEYLDLGFNDFQESKTIPEFSYLTKLNHLDLSMSNFSASISTQISNLSFLEYLDLSCTLSDSREIVPVIITPSCLESSSTKWVKSLVNLQVLRLRGIDLFEATSSKHNIGEDISYLPNLRDVDISWCSISGQVFPIHQFHNLSHLSTLQMNRNSIYSSFPVQLANLSSLSVLDLSCNHLQGSIPYLPRLKKLDVSFNYDFHPWLEHRKLQSSETSATGSVQGSISNAPLLVSLSASKCSIQGSLPSSIYNLSRLQYLDLSENQITGSLRSSISNLKYLNFLDLSGNRIRGPIPKSICKISHLQYLELRNNNISGTIPSCITKLQHLSVFDVYGNSITGNVSLISFIHELNLTSLDLSSNKLTVVIDRHLYPPNFKLKRLFLASCNMKGFIPTSICDFIHLKNLDFSHNNFRGAIPSCISRLKNLTYLNLSGNKLRGPLPLLPLGVDELDLSNNKLHGEISEENGEKLSSIRSYNLNDNELSGPLPSSLCSQNPEKSSTKTEQINLSNNKLSGVIPSNIGNCSSLNHLNLVNNSLTGNIPNELQKAKYMSFLYLSDNNFHGKFPIFIQKHLFLIVLTLGNNNFEGPIPTGLGSLSNLAVLSLRSNRFNGSIPEDIIKLESLQILDLSFNKFSGPIPSRLGNLTWLANRFLPSAQNSNVEYWLAMKGSTTLFKQDVLYSSGIDLSCNILDGNIPEDISLLIGLQMLNLSHNLFSSRIPEHIGNMSRLESLDLSSNRLFGHIPQSLASIDSLQFLILSNNNLSGRIPRGTHFDTLSLDGSAFAGNDLLCGFPIEDCEGDHKISTGSTNPQGEVDEDDRDGGKEKFLLYAIVAMGCAVGFWGLFFVLLLKKQKWWFPYWSTINSVAVKIVECIHKKQQ